MTYQCVLQINYIFHIKYIINLKPTLLVQLRFSNYNIISSLKCAVPAHFVHFMYIFMNILKHPKLFHYYNAILFNFMLTLLITFSLQIISNYST